MKLGIFIAVYKESEQLEPLLRFLGEDAYQDKEIYVCVDEPTEKTKSLIDSIGGKITFRVSATRLGKVEALNSAVMETECDAMVFLDSDIEIHQEGFLTLVAEEMKRFDVIEIKKKIIQDSFIAQIINYDYLSANFTNFLFSRYVGRCLAVNGSAFAIRRDAFDLVGGFGKEICEDLDIATRTYLNGLRFGYADDVEIQNKVSPSWRIWFKQRRRWGIGQAHWLQSHFRDIINSIIKNPKTLVAALLIIFPSLPLLIGFIITPDTIYMKTASFFLIFLAGKELILVPPIAALLLGTTFLRFFIAAVVIYITFAVVFYYFAKRLGYSFGLPQFTFYFFIYNPLWLIISIVMLIRVLLWRNNYKLDWKV